MKTLPAFSLRMLWRKPALAIFSLFHLTVANVQAQLSFSGQPVPASMEYTNSNGSGVVQTADINKDGYIDIVFSNGITAGAGLVYWQNNGNGTFSTPAVNPFGAYTASTPAGLILNITSSIADFDCDGDLDIWGRVHGDGNDVYLRNDNGTYTTQSLPAGLEYSPTSGAGVVQVADFNNDGCVDVLYSNGTSAGAGLVYLQNNGSGTFNTPAVNPFAAFLVSTPAALILNTTSSIADFDGDGDLDIWGRASGAANDAFLRNDNGTYTSQAVPTGMEFTNSGGTGVVQTGDFNGDGFIDILFSNGATTGAGLMYWQNNGSGSFSTPATNPFASLTGSTPAGTILNTNCSIADFDGDGDLDIWTRVHNAGNDSYIQSSGQAPRLLSSTPVNNASSVVRDAVIYLRFNENVKVGNGAIYIHRASNGQILQIIGANSSAVTGSGTTTLAINPLADLDPFTSYYVTYSKGAILDVNDDLLFGYLDPVTKQRMPYNTSSFLRFTTSGILPVSLTNFTATEEKGKALLKWQTLSEQNSAAFTIQRSFDGTNWQNIGTVAAAGNSTTLRQYSFDGPQLIGGKNYFRLLQTDLDSRQQASDVRLLKKGAGKGFKLYPNPATTTTALQLEEDAPAQVSIYNPGGQLVWKQTKATTTIVLPVEHLTRGLYQVEVSQNGERFSQPLLVQ